jgi:hypothetical protein
MGWLKKAVILFVGLALLGTGFFFIGLLCLGYLVASFFFGKGKASQRAKGGLSVNPRYILAFVLFAVSLLALASGGTFSPIVFGTMAAAVLLWPVLPFGYLVSRVVPVKDSILLRSSLVPVVWHSFAQVKPGAEDIPRALSSYKGRLVVTRSGSVYSHVKTFALTARSAEEKVNQELRRMASSITPGGAYLLPLDSQESSRAFSGGYSSISQKGDPLAGPAPDLLVLDASGSTVARYGSYEVAKGGRGNIIIPETHRVHRNPPLTWEALERLGKKLKWPDPDNYSNLLQSVHATQNEQLAERFSNLETAGDRVAVQGLGGDRVELSRAQLRAMVSIYS